jgi:two-component system sensor histidine kinase EvgS
LEVPSVSESRGSYNSVGYVLVVDDHPDNRLMVAEELRTFGIQAVLVGDGRAAIEAIEHQSIVLVLMDCHMPDMDGYETTRRIRQREAQFNLQRIPIVAISAATGTDHLKRCLDCGMDSVLQKPLRPKALRSMMGLWLEQLLPEERAVIRSVADRPRFDLFKLYRISFERDALELEGAVAQEDLEWAAFFAHRIKGAAMMAGAGRVALEACRVEECAEAADIQGLAEASVALRLEIAAWVATPRH